MSARTLAPRQTAWAKVVLLWFCGVGAGLQFAKASVGFDALAAHYHASAALVGWLLSAVGMVGALFGAAAGLLVARLGLERSLVGALALGSLIAFFQASLPPVWVFLASRVIEGGAYVAIIIAAPSSLAPFCAPRHRAIVLSLWGTFFSVSFLLAGAAGPPLLAAFGLEGLFIAHALLMATLALAALVWLRPMARPPRTDPGALAQTLFEQHLEIYADLRTAMPAFCFCCYTSMYLALQTLTPELAPPGDRRWLFAAMPFVSVVTTLTAGALSQNWMSPFRLTAWAFAATLASSLLLHVGAYFDLAVAPLALARMAFISLLPGAIYPMIPLLCSTAPMQARAYGAIAQMSNVGAVIGPPIFGASLAAVGSLGLLAPTLAFCACGGALASLVGRRFASART